MKPPRSTRNIPRFPGPICVRFAGDLSAIKHGCWKGYVAFLGTGAWLKLNIKAWKCIVTSHMPTTHLTPNFGVSKSKGFFPTKKVVSFWMVLPQNQGMVLEQLNPHTHGSLSKKKCGNSPKRNVWVEKCCTNIHWKSVMLIEIRWTLIPQCLRDLMHRVAVPVPN